MDKQKNNAITQVHSQAANNKQGSSGQPMTIKPTVTEIKIVPSDDTPIEPDGYPRFLNLSLDTPAKSNIVFREITTLKLGKDKFQAFFAQH